MAKWTKLAAGAAALLTVAGGGAVQAQSAFGDTKLSYSNGVIYDDDLVPGRGQNQSFLGGDQDQAFSSSGQPVPAPSQNLIGSDGRTIDAIRRDRSQATAVNEIINRRDL